MSPSRLPSGGSTIGGAGGVTGRGVAVGRGITVEVGLAVPGVVGTVGVTPGRSVTPGVSPASLVGVGRGRGATVVFVTVWLGGSGGSYHFRGGTVGAGATGGTTGATGVGVGGTTFPIGGGSAVRTGAVSGVGFAVGNVCGNGLGVTGGFGGMARYRAGVMMAAISGSPR